MNDAGSPAIFRVGGYAVPHNVASGIGKASTDTGVSFSFLMTQAGKESAFSPEVASSASSAVGLFQFTRQTWLGLMRRYGENYGLEAVTREIYRGPDGSLKVDDPETLQRILDTRKDPGLSSLIAGEYAKSNRALLESALGREVTETELYLAHFLGPAGAKHILQARMSAPGTPAADIMPEAASSNPSFFFTADNQARSVQQFYDRVERALAKSLRHYAAFESHPDIQNVLRPSLDPDPEWPFEVTSAALSSEAPDAQKEEKTVGESFPGPALNLVSPPPDDLNWVSADRATIEISRPPGNAYAGYMPLPPDGANWPFETPSSTAALSAPPAAHGPVPAPLLAQDMGDADGKEAALAPAAKGDAAYRKQSALLPSEALTIETAPSRFVSAERVEIAISPRPDPAETQESSPLTLVLRSVGKALFGS